MKKTISYLLVLCMFAALFSGMAFAVEETSDAAPAEIVETAEAASEQEAPQAAEAAAEQETAAEPAAAAETAEAEPAFVAEDAAEAEAEQTDAASEFKSAFGSQLYVAPNAEAGLAGEIAVKFSLAGATLYLPGKADASKLCFSWDDPAVVAVRDGVEYRSGTAPVAIAGERVTYQFTNGKLPVYVTVRTVQGSADVEPMFLELDESLGTIDAMNKDDEHETKCFGKVLFDGHDNFVSIKGRGNSTWSFSKKPYNITLHVDNTYDKKQKEVYIPGVKKCNKYCLLANYLDNSLIRNKIAMDLANTMGIGLGTRFVDVWMNGEYLGNYLMTPKKDLNVKDKGFMIDNDHIPEDVDQFKIEGMHDMPLKHNRINIEEIGDDLVEAGIGQEYIEAYVNEAFAALIDYDTENYQNYFDLDSWAKMYLMVEVSKTYDCYAGNFLMRRDGLKDTDKLIAGPAWDYDIAFGRTLHKFLVWQTEPMQLNAEGWFNDSIGAIAVDKPVSLLQELGKHESFMLEVARVYNEYKADFEALAANVDHWRDEIRASALMNNVLWGTHSLSADYLVAPTTMSLLGTEKYALHYDVTLTWDNYVNNVKEFVTKRVMWLSDHLAMQAPEGSIVKKTLANGGVVLQAAVTAGNTRNTFQWQRSDDGETWTDIDGATAQRYKPEVDESGSVLYRCVVKNAEVDIVTVHGGTVTLWAETVFEPASVSVSLAETKLRAGELTLTLDGQDMGEYRFKASGEGWTIQKEDGRYLTVSGRRIVWSSDDAMAWKLENGAFTATAELAVTALGKLLTLGYMRDVYLTVSDGSLAISTRSGAQAGFLAPVAG